MFTNGELKLFPIPDKYKRTVRSDKDYLAYYSGNYSEDIFNLRDKNLYQIGPLFVNALLREQFSVQFVDSNLYISVVRSKIPVKSRDGRLYKRIGDDLYILTNDETKIEIDLTKKISVIHLSLEYYNSSDNITKSHSNILILDNLEKTAERFDSHGITSEWIPISNNIIDEKVKLLLDMILITFESYKYISPLDYSCPEYTIARGNYCSIWSYIYLIHRLQYPNVPRAMLVKFLHDELNKESNKNYIQYFEQYMHIKTSLILSKLNTNMTINVHRKRLGFSNYLIDNETLDILRKV
jgi:hypothetical protein